jgi:hypothetical protein
MKKLMPLPTFKDLKPKANENANAVARFQGFGIVWGPKFRAYKPMKTPIPLPPLLLVNVSRPSWGKKQ